MAMTIRPFMPHALLCFGIAALLLWPCAAEASRPFQEAEREPRRFRLLRPKMDEPAAQLQHADALRERGRLRRAQRQYRALVRYWSNTPEAAQAQYAYAQVLEERGKLSRAFDQYEYLIENYTGMFPHKEVLGRIFDIGETAMEQRRGRFLIFPGFQAPERAVPYFESVVTHGPRWERAPEAQWHIARIKEDTDRLEEAVFAYDRLESRYPRSPFVEEAAFGKARTLYQLAREYPNHVDRAETALHALGLFVRNHPESEYVEEAREKMRTLHREIARITYEKARYYDRIARRPRAAVTTYERFLEEFPDSEWSDQARERLNTLRAKLEDQDEG